MATLSYGAQKTRMMPKPINADKPHLWKADIAASVDQFNTWFMRFDDLAKLGL